MITTTILTFIAAIQANPAEQKTLDLLSRSGAEIRVEPMKPTGYEIWIDYNKPVSDDALKPIAGLQNLTALRIMGGGFGDAGLKYVKNVPRLWLLVLTSDKITDAGMETISKIQTLTKLDVMKARITRRGIECVTNLKKMERLFFYSAKVTDADLEPLKRMTWLHQLCLPTTVSDVTFKSFQKALPRTAVERR